MGTGNKEIVFMKWWNIGMGKRFLVISFIGELVGDLFNDLKYEL